MLKRRRLAALFIARGCRLALAPGVDRGPSLVLRQAWACQPTFAQEPWLAALILSSTLRDGLLTLEFHRGVQMPLQVVLRRL
jgi:hypothetical protein